MPAKRRHQSAISRLQDRFSQSERKSGSSSVLIEHSYRFQGIISQIFADQRQLPEDVIGHGYDMTANRIRLKNIEQLTRACPYEPGVRRGGQPVHCLGHQRHGVHAGIGDAAGKHRDVSRRSPLYRIDYRLDLIEGKDGRDVKRDTVAGQPSDQAFTPRVGDRDLDCDVLALCRNVACLPFHVRKLVGEDLERDRSVRYRL
jgi:hypothetical protein